MANTTYELIYHFSRGNIPPAKIPQELSTIFDARDYKTALQQMQEPDLRMWVERLDQIIDSKTYPEELRKRTLRSLRKTCGLRSILPKSHYFPGRLFKTENRAVSGGAADVWRVTDDRKHILAAKVIRVIRGEEYKIKRFYKEVTIWKRLNHPNVVPTFGASPDFAEFCVVSPWMPDGELLQYLRKYPGVDRVGIMLGVAEGLSYLHHNDVIHGDIKGVNILFDNTGVPRLSDFGISSITLNQTPNASTPFQACSIRWMAPEILGAPNGHLWRSNKMTDVYAFGMVVVEIFTGKAPFPDTGDFDVPGVVLKGKRPPKPADASKMGLSSARWKVVEECWHKRGEKRPDVPSIIYRLRKA